MLIEYHVIATGFPAKEVETGPRELAKCLATEHPMIDQDADIEALDIYSNSAEEDVQRNDAGLPRSCILYPAVDSSPGKLGSSLQKAA
jgi:hypothetical protein